MTYLDALADEIRRAVPSDALPDEDTSSLFRIYAVLLLAKGEEVTHEDVHNAWVAWMLERGETHESMVPFAELSAETQAEDSPFMVAVRTAARQHRVEAPNASPADGSRASLQGDVNPSQVTPREHRPAKAPPTQRTQAPRTGGT